MRKYLLAGAAMFGATMAVQGSAYAQAPAPAAPVLAAPPMGTLITPNFGKSANDNNNYQAVAIPGAVVNPTPGSMVIRLNGKIWSEFGVEGSTGDQAGTNNGNKLAPYSMDTYLRLYPGVSGMSTNGLRWGAQAEIRENFQGQGFIATPSSSTTSITATNAQNSSSTTGNSGLTCSQTLYVRRAFVWIAQDQVGIFRLGQGDGPAGIFDNGITTFQGFGSSGWNGDAPNFTNGNSSPTFPWFSQQGAEYGSNKIVYLSPQFFGVDLGVSFAPNNGNGGGAYNCSNASTIGCPLLSSSNQVSAGGIPTDNFRERNLAEAGARYQGVAGPVSIYGFGTFIGANHVNYTGPAVTPAILGVPGSKYNGQVTDVSAGFVGAAFTIAGFQFGGAWQGGHYNGVMAPAPNGAPPAEAYLVGAQYTNGPYTIGASWYGFDQQGAVALTGISQRHSNAFAAGANYQITPGLQVYADYVYGTNHQGDYNFVTGSAGSPLHNSAYSQAAVIGLLVGW
jgi:predicted porin